jgi:hypothetical protein
MYKGILIIACFSIILSNVYSQESFSDQFFSIESFSDELFSINGIAYDNFDFRLDKDYNLPYNHMPITIHGWSKNGNIFYSYVLPFYGRLYRIKNLIDDEVIWEADYYDFKRANFSKDFITGIVNRFNIELFTGIIGEFPYKWNNNMYECFGANERRIIGNELSIDIFIKMNENKQKKINSVSTKPAWLLNNITDNLRYRYIKSPFENRIAVIILIPQIHSEFDYLYYNIEILGCHLESGFN